MQIGSGPRRALVVLIALALTGSGCATASTTPEPAPAADAPVVAPTRPVRAVPAGGVESTWAYRPRSAVGELRWAPPPAAWTECAGHAFATRPATEGDNGPARRPRLMVVNGSGRPGRHPTPEAGVRVLPAALIRQLQAADAAELGRARGMVSVSMNYRSDGSASRDTGAHRGAGRVRQLRVGDQQAALRWGSATSPVRRRHGTVTVGGERRGLWWEPLVAPGFSRLLGRPCCRAGRVRSPPSGGGGRRHGAARCPGLRHDRRCGRIRATLLDDQNTAPPTRARDAVPPVDPARDPDGRFTGFRC